MLVAAAVGVTVLGAARWTEERHAAVAAAGDVFTVVVDAGHGGFDGGAVGTETGVKEDGLNLAVASLVRDRLEKAGVRVVMTRTDGGALGRDKKSDLAERKRIFHDEHADLVVSIHMNMFTDPDISGPMAYYMQGSAEGQKLAQTVIDCLSDALGRNRRLANPGDYFVVRECDCPAVLVECGFLSNAADERLLQTEAHRVTLADAISEGILDYAGKISA